MNNTIQEVSVDLHDWRDEQEAWNNRSKFFVELHNRADRKAQVTDFLAFLRMNIYYLQMVAVLSILVVVSVITHLD